MKASLTYKINIQYDTFKKTFEVSAKDITECLMDAEKQIYDKFDTLDYELVDLQIKEQ